jgi:transketolase
MLNEGTDVTIIATGHLVYPSLKAAEELEEKGISAEVINIHTIKPLDEEIILESVQKTKAVVTAEEHLRNGGLGDSVAQLLGRKNPVPVEMVAINDTFGESGKPNDLLKKYNIDKPDVINAAEKVVERKKIFLKNISTSSVS